ncbi:hypothetical protein BURKHO8Y_30112 [Burkholderia sp. 8Y]|nr:hypothetical protein BURKHO8Y_30112 [Burkholderia sp. 8Y]
MNLAMLMPLGLPPFGLENSTLVPDLPEDVFIRRILAKDSSTYGRVSEPGLEKSFARNRSRLNRACRGTL